MTLGRGEVHWLGEGIDYAWAWGLQRELLEQRVAGERGDTLLLLGHAPVYTAGRRSVPEDVLSQLDAPLVETDRGGQTTYHGPGQLVGYPIVSLADLGLGPRRYVAAVESALLAALGEYGIPAHREQGLTGVWTTAGKIAAIGVKVSRGVTMHGFALNVATDLRAYDAIVPCGIGDRPVTSLHALLSRAPDLKEAAYVVAEALGASLGIAWRAR
ncbi:MAG: lipoyl(octanoyl) transferase LipB [Chloroflexi bacterium]|nr:lipoyl(octanoyl) transferase LipB [Chloroflexota bacterium]